MIMCIQNLVLIGLFVFKILSKNSILTSIKGSNSVANLPKFELIQAFMHVLLTCKNEVDQLKMMEPLCSQDFSHYKSMGIFPDAQGQLTTQSLVRSGRILNSLEMSLLPASMKKIRSKIEFFRWARADNSGVGGGIWLKFELIQAFMHVLVTCKNEDDQIQNEGARVFTRFLPL